VGDPIRTPWADAGWEQSSLGYPTAPATGHAGSPARAQDFQHGTLHSDRIFNRVSLHGGRVVAVSTPWVDWTSFGTMLNDGDVISATFTPGSVNGASVITLTAGPGINWWKGLTVWSPTQGNLFHAWTQDGRTTDNISVPVTTLESPVLLQFGKAKEFGLHRAVYHLLRADQLIGSHVTFTWTRQ
jgi:hypothetical protein